MTDNISITEGTQTTIATDDVSGVQFQKVKLDVGGDGVSSPFTGSLANVGVIHNAGTIAAIPQVSVGTIPQVSVGTLPVLSLDTGTITTGSLSNIAELHDGTVVVKTIPQISVGTLPTVTLPDPVGSVVMTVGTIADVPGGTVDLVSQANVTVGTFSADIPGGTIDEVSQANVTVGTFSADVPGGTIDSLTFGTVDTYYRHPDEFATTVSTGTSTLGTIKAAVPGSVIYVTDVKISVQAASNVVIASGGTSTPIIGTNFFAGSGGMVSNYVTPARTASGSALVYKQSSNTGMSIDVTGYVD